MAIATGPKKEVRAKKESSFNVAAGATGVQGPQGLVGPTGA